MSKIIEWAFNLAKKTSLWSEFGKTIAIFEWMIPFKKKSAEAKAATVEEVKNSYIALAQSLGKKENSDIDIIKNFFWDAKIFSGWLTQDFIKLNNELRTLAQAKWIKDIKVFDNVVKVGQVEIVGEMGSLLVNAFDPLKKGAQSFNLTYDETDLGEIDADLATLCVECKNNIWEDKEYNNEDDFDEWEEFEINGEKLLWTEDATKEANKILDFAHSLLWVPYVWWGEDRNWCDCSWLTQYSFTTWWILWFPRTAAEQFNHKKLIDRNWLPKRWDMMFFENLTRKPIGKKSHVAFVEGYLADGRIVVTDASTNSKKVSTRIILPESPKYKYHFKDPSELYQNINIGMLDNSINKLSQAA